MSDEPSLGAEGPHETRDASVAGVLMSVGGVGVLIAVALLTGVWLCSGRSGVRRPDADQSFRNGPAELSDVVRVWPEIERETHDHLATYGWVDRPGGVVRIPIDRAIERMVP